MERKQLTRDSKEDDCSQVEALGHDFRRPGIVISHNEINLSLFVLHLCLHSEGLQRQNAGIVPLGNVARENIRHRGTIKN